MKFRTLLLLGLLPLAACSLQLGDNRGGWSAPPHAHPRYAPPPYGEWRWDDDLSVYVILGYPHLYYRDRIYYRWRDGGWYWGDRYDGPWKPGHYQNLPPGLHQRYPQPRGGDYRQGGNGQGQHHDSDRGNSGSNQNGQGHERYDQGQKKSQGNVEHGNDKHNYGASQQYSQPGKGVQQQGQPIQGQSKKQSQGGQPLKQGKGQQRQY